MTTKTHVVTVRLTREQHQFFSDWQDTLRKETGLDVPMGAIVRRALDGFIHHASQREEERPENGTPGTRNEAIRNYLTDYDKE